MTNLHVPDTGAKTRSGPKEWDASQFHLRHRRRAVLEAFDRLRPGDSLVLRYDRHPLPILFSLTEDRFGQFTGRFLERGPIWRVLITRI